MFSGLYLTLALMLLALILRGLSFEFRGKRDSLRWRRFWSGALIGGSLVVPLLVGIALADLLHGLPIDDKQEYTGDFCALLSGYSVFTGLTIVAICLMHGAAFRDSGSWASWVVGALAAAAAVWFISRRQGGRAFAATPSPWPRRSARSSSVSTRG